MKKRTLFILGALLIAAICAAFVGLYFAPPSPPDVVDEVRMTIKPAGTKEGISFLRIYYGYRVGGKWYDYPMEYYDLKSIFTSNEYSGFDAADCDHIVKIGQYAVIALFSYTPVGESSLGRWEASDTLGSELQNKFIEYSSLPQENIEYGLKTSPNKIQDMIFPGSRYTSPFGYYYYVVLDYDSLPEDYVFSYILQGKQATTTYELTYDQIRRLLEKS